MYASLNRSKGNLTHYLQKGGRTLESPVETATETERDRSGLSDGPIKHKGEQKTLPEPYLFRQITMSSVREFQRGGVFDVHVQVLLLNVPVK